MTTTHTHQKQPTSSGPIVQTQIVANHQASTPADFQHSSAVIQDDLIRDQASRSGTIFENVASSFQDPATIQRQPAESSTTPPQGIWQRLHVSAPDVLQQGSQPETKRRLKVSDFQAGQQSVQRQVEPKSITTAITQPVLQREDAPAPQPLRQGNQGLGGTTATLGADLDKLYEEAAVAQQELYKQASAVAGATKGEAKLPDSLKKRDRATEKTLADYKGDAGLLFDIARGSIMYNSYADLLEGLTTCQKSLNVVREKNRFAEPTPAGYRDILLNVRMSNGHIAELQLHLTQILQVKSDMHKLYDEMRKIQDDAKKAQRDLLPEEIAKIDQLNQESRAAYDAALAQAQL